MASATRSPCPTWDITICNMMLVYIWKMLLLHVHRSMIISRLHVSFEMYKRGVVLCEWPFWFLPSGSQEHLPKILLHPFISICVHTPSILCWWVVIVSSLMLFMLLMLISHMWMKILSDFRLVSYVVLFKPFLRSFHCFCPILNNLSESLIKFFDRTHSDLG